MGIATQSEQRYRRIFDGHYREVYAYCRRRTDAATAADAATETFLVAWRRVDDVPGGDAALGWLFGVARRVLANEFRANRRRLSLLNRLRDNHRSGDATPEMVVVRRERDERVLAAMARLRPEEQELLRLALWEQVPHREIAAVLDCSTEAVTQRVYRATRRVAKEYERLDHGHAAVGTHRPLRGGETT